jgi:hypothetical protein
VRKTYQTDQLDTSHLAVPNMVSVALAELAGEMREGLLALPLDGCLRSGRVSPGVAATGCMRTKEGRSCRGEMGRCQLRGSTF